MVITETDWTLAELPFSTDLVTGHEGEFVLIIGKVGEFSTFKAIPLSADKIEPMFAFAEVGNDLIAYGRILEHISSDKYVVAFRWIKRDKP